MEAIKSGKKLFNAVIIIVVFGLSAYVSVRWIVMPVIVSVAAIKQLLWLEVSVKVAVYVILIFAIVRLIDWNKHLLILRLFMKKGPK